MKVKIEAYADDRGERLKGSEVMDALEKHLGLDVERVSISELVE